MARTNGYIRREVVDPRRMRGRRLPGSTVAVSMVDLPGNRVSGQVALNADKLAAYIDNEGAQGDFTLILPRSNTLRRASQQTIITAAASVPHKVSVQTSGSDRFDMHGQRHCVVVLEPGSSVACSCNGQGSNWSLRSMSTLVAYP